MVDNESAQLAQYAANLPRVALRSQSPPVLNGGLPLQLVGYLVGESAETLPNACTVLPGEALGQAWMNDSEGHLQYRISFVFSKKKVFNF